MKNRFLLLAPLLLLPAVPAQALDVSGSATATSDYVFRGISQTGGDPALQAGLRLAATGGFYGALWASHVDYGDAIGSDAEVDYTLGWSGQLATGWSLDANVTRYTYPGTQAGLELDYNELVTTLTWNDRWYGVLGYSNDVFASGGNGTWLQAGARWPVANAWTFDAALAHYELDDVLSDSYQVATVGVTWTRGAFSARGTGHLTSDSAEDLFGDVGKPRFEFAAGWAF